MPNCNGIPYIADGNEYWWCPDCGDPVAVCAAWGDCPMSKTSKKLKVINEKPEWQEQFIAYFEIQEEQQK